MPKSIIDLNATKENAINELNDFIDNRLHSYESLRNYDLGENNHQNVSLLSPYIRHRLITEQEVISAALNKFPLPT
jgi:deoxyribodipyrimidine photo-lyase